MFSRVQNRNAGYSENLFSQNPRMENNTLSSIDGATALKLDESFELEQQEESNIMNNIENHLKDENVSSSMTEQVANNLPSGVSIESASYMENNKIFENNNSSKSFENDDEYTPKLFTDDQDNQLDAINTEINDQENVETDQLFDQDVNEEEDFEIPAFLRKQKF